MYYQLKILYLNFQSETKASHFQTFKKLENLSPACILAETTTHDYIPVKIGRKKKKTWYPNNRPNTGVQCKVIPG